MKPKNNKWRRGLFVGWRVEAVNQKVKARVWMCRQVRPIEWSEQSLRSTQRSPSEIVFIAFLHIFVIIIAPVHPKIPLSSSQFFFAIAIKEKYLLFFCPNLWGSVGWRVVVSPPDWPLRLGRETPTCRTGDGKLRPGDHMRPVKFFIRPAELKKLY